MAKYTVDINGTFSAVVEVELEDDEISEDENDVEQTVYELAEKTLQGMIDQNDWDLVENVELECVNYDEVKEKPKPKTK